MTCRNQVTTELRKMPERLVIMRLVNRRLHLVALVVAGALLAGCGGESKPPVGAPPDDTQPPTTTAPPTPEDRWRSHDISSYDFVYHASAMAGACELLVQVRDDEVESATVKQSCMWLKPKDALTIDDVFTTLSKELRESDEVNATYDPEYGFPTSVDVDRIRNAIDDEWSFGVSDFVPKETETPD
jgi:hypothetical protein